MTRAETGIGRAAAPRPLLERRGDGTKTKHPTRAPAGARGASVVEILVASAAAFLVLASCAQTVLAQHELWRLQDSRMRLREGARRVSEAIAREIRGAGFDPLPGGPFDGATDGVSVATVEAIELLADRGGAPDGSPDGAADPASDERIGFYRSAGQRSVYETIGGLVAPLLDGPEVPPGGLVFRYFDACGGELVPGVTGLDAATRPRVASVRVRLVLEDPASRERVEAGTVVALRNRQELACAS